MLNIFDEDNLVDWEGERLLPTNANLDTSVNHIIRYQFAKKIMKGKCLDAACGAGYGTYLLSENHNADVVGIDIEESAVLWASKAYAGNKNLYFEVKDIYATEYQEASFETIASFETLEHLPELDNYFKEIHRILSHEGIAIFSVPDWHTNNGAGNINKYHLNELTFEQFKEYTGKYFGSCTYYYQEILKPSFKVKLRSAIASLLPLKIKALIKNFLAKNSKDIRFNGKNFNELEEAHKSLFNSYKVKEIKSYFDSKDKRDNTRYVFIAVCEKNL